MNRKEQRALKSLERKMGKTPNEMDLEFGQLCAQAGQIQFQIKILTGQLNSVNQKMADLSKKFHTLKATEADLTKTEPQAPVEPIVEVPQEVKDAV